MGRSRLSTTVDADLLERARNASGKPDAALVDEALAALLARHRAAEVDVSYEAYHAHPLDEPDAWEIWRMKNSAIGLRHTGPTRRTTDLGLLDARSAKRSKLP